MEEFEREQQWDNKVRKGQTFSVPFPLEEIKENISISTKTTAQATKEQIINQAFKYHSQGNILEAGKYYKYFIDQGFTDPRIFSNYGNILNDLGKLQEAEIYTRKAIKLQPDFADPYSNLGNILRGLGKLQEAEIYTRKAIQIKPDFAEPHCNLGNILLDLGQLKEAEIYTRKAIQIKPDLANAYLNLGTILSNLGKLQEAEIYTRKAIQIKPNLVDAHLNLGTILSNLGKLKEALVSYLKAIEIGGNELKNYALITDFLLVYNPSELNKKNLKDILNHLLERDNISHKDLFGAFNTLYEKELIDYLKRLSTESSRKDLLYRVTSDDLLIKGMKKIPFFRNFKWEKLLTSLRKHICNNISQGETNIKYSELHFLIALGEQCFLNEYVYSLTKEENISISKIITQCRNGKINEASISILACYLPLYKLLDKIPSLKSFTSSDKNFNELIKLQILEPLEEIELSQNIKKLGSINNDVSQKVKDQYEKNPYPRWRHGNFSKDLQKSFIEVINSEIKPNSINSSIRSNQLRILIAGCGTGNQILQSQRYKNALIKGIDISSSSLSYAQRKINEIGINNVELIQMDILKVDLLEEQFDIIECGGVLHHMDDPLQGLKILLGNLKPNGFLKLGLYSELARKHIIKAREYISRNKLQPNENDIRHFRESVFSGKSPEINSLIFSTDFYTMSSCRDLCFHVQEHRFTINQIERTLNSNKLKFWGFILAPPVKSLYNKYFPEDKAQTNLKNWAKFEECNPNTFNGMYQFWVSKGE